MAGTTFDIREMFSLTFGFEHVQPDFKPAPILRETSALGANYRAKDALGREYYFPVTLGGITLPYPLIRIQGKKTIIETPMVARRGTVKEMISIDDYRISIRGLIVGHDGNWPEDQVTALRDLYEKNEALTIESVLTAIFLGQPEQGGSDKVVITSIDFPETRGAENVTGYQMELVSDQALELTIKS